MFALERNKKRDFIEKLILENRQWAQVIARNVAKAWRLDPEVDGLISASLEALVECAHRYEVERGIPFRAYARRRVHEAACDAARATKAWKEGQVFSGSLEAKARSTAYELFKRFPELREGCLPSDATLNSLRGSVRQLLLGATIIHIKEQQEQDERRDFSDYRRLITAIARLDKIHQWLIWKVYWEGFSLRGLASAWDSDPLTIIREHQVILSYFSNIFLKNLEKTTPPRVRPSLKKVFARLKLLNQPSPFEEFLKNLGSY
ncbi:MAG: hypothetical protein NZT61_06855 [Deltaproteobacteria bacterium]|nr:hypothetical protein [Deltaproteobacteria bacterium]